MAPMYGSSSGAGSSSSAPMYQQPPVISPMPAAPPVEPSIPSQATPSPGTAQLAQEAYGSEVTDQSLIEHAAGAPPGSMSDPQVQTSMQALMEYQRQRAEEMEGKALAYSERALQQRAYAQELLTQAQNGGQLTPQQSLGMLFATLLPMIAGAALKGKMGAYAGLQAAGEGGVAGMKAKALQSEAERDLAVRQANMAESEATSLDVLGSRYDTRANKIIDDLAVRSIEEQEAIDKTARGLQAGKDLAVFKKGLETPKETAADKQQAILERKAMEADLGLSRKDLDPASRDGILSVRNSLYAMQKIRNIVARNKGIWTKEAGSLNNLTTFINTLKGKLPESDMNELSAMKDYLQLMTSRSYVRGATTEQENATVKNIIGGDNKSVSQMLTNMGNLEDILNTSLRTARPVFEAQYKPDQVKALFDTKLGIEGGQGLGGGGGGLDESGLAIPDNMNINVKTPEGRAKMGAFMKMLRIKDVKEMYVYSTSETAKLERGEAAKAQRFFIKDGEMYVELPDGVTKKVPKELEDKYVGEFERKRTGFKSNK